MSREKTIDLSLVKKGEINFGTIGIENGNNIPSGLIISSEIWETKDKMKYISTKIYSDTLNRIEFPVDIYSVAEKRKEDESIYYRLYFSKSNFLRTGFLSVILDNYLDDYGTFFKRLKSMTSGVKSITKDITLNWYSGFQFGNESIDIVCDPNISDEPTEESIVGYYIKDSSISEEEDGNFYFKNKETSSKYLSYYLENLEVEYIDGGKIFNFRKIFTFTDEELNLLLEEFYMEKTILNTSPYLRDTIC